MKKALLITTISGFVPQFEFNSVHILNEFGYEIHYASNFHNPVYITPESWYKEERITKHQIAIHKSPFHFCTNIRAFKELVRIIDDEQITLVHCHNPVGGVVGRLAAHFSKTKPITIYTAHGFHFYEGAGLVNWLFFYPVEKWLARYTDRLITINHEDYARAKSFRLKKNGKVKMIPGVGVNLQKFRDKIGNREEKRKELGIAEDAFFILSVGELNQNKNHEAVIRAIAELGDKDIYYGICGRGAAKKYLEDLIRELGYSDRIKLFGYRSDIDEMLQAADCFAFPSKREGLGIAGIEALAGEIPLITTDNRGTREYMQDGINGYVVTEDSAHGFAEAIQKMKSLSKDEYLEMKKNCGLKAERFGLEETNLVMRRIYSKYR